MHVNGLDDLGEFNYFITRDNIPVLLKGDGNRNRLWPAQAGLQRCPNDRSLYGRSFPSVLLARIYYFLYNTIRTFTYSRIL